jgi:hypothetical protein
MEIKKLIMHMGFAFVGCRSGRKKERKFPTVLMTYHSSGIIEAWEKWGKITFVSV